MSLQDYSAGELMPRRLSPAEIQDPLSVIHDFFQYAHLPEIREQLWEMLKTTVTGGYCHELSHRERTDLIHFYEKLEKLVEAAHLLHNMSALPVPS
ncbi:MAG: hypothetical protein ABW019_07955 [Chitinophagaceae bacterium]